MLKLRPGSTWSVELAQTPAGWVLSNVLRAGRTEVKRTRIGTYATEEEMWIARERLAQRRLAELGLEKTKR